MTHHANSERSWFDKYKEIESSSNTQIHTFVNCEYIMPEQVQSQTLTIYSLKGKKMQL